MLVPSQKGRVLEIQGRKDDSYYIFLFLFSLKDAQSLLFALILFSALLFCLCFMNDSKSISFSVLTYNDCVLLL